MLWLIKCRAALISKAARTFYWLVFAIAICVAIVLFLDSLNGPDGDVLSSPNYEFIPRPNKRAVIHFSYKNLDSVTRWTKKIDQSLDPYKREHPHIVDCGFNKLPTVNETCKVDLEAMAPCVHSNGYGYSKGSPCIFIKLKKVLGWIPEYLKPEGMEKAGLSRRFVDDVERITIDSPKKLRSIWVSCGGRTAVDQELIGKVRYLPWRGVPGYFFPYKGQDIYMEPIVAIKFESPTTDIVIDIDCKIVAQNMNETISFRLLVDEDAV